MNAPQTTMIHKAIQAGLTPAKLQEAWQYSSLDLLAQKHGMTVKELQALAARWPVKFRGDGSGRRPTVIRISIERTHQVLPKLHEVFGSYRGIAEWAKTYVSEIHQRWRYKGMPLDVYERIERECPEVLL